jgi:hypothetical protein
MQDLGQTVPEALYNDRAYPLATLYLYGQPMAGCRLELFYWLLIPVFQTLAGHRARLQKDFLRGCGPHWHNACSRKKRAQLTAHRSKRARRPDQSPAAGFCGRR